jgi:hypothetical protein
LSKAYYYCPFLERSFACASERSKARAASYQRLPQLNNHSLELK